MWDSEPRDPILIIGGFGSNAGQYAGLRSMLADVSGRPTVITPLNLLDWLGVVASDSYGVLLGVLHRTIQATLTAHGAQRLTLVAHSAGGVLARIYLGDRAYGPRNVTFHGRERVRTLVTLGTPHTTTGTGRQGGLNQIRFVQEAYPGAYWPDVRYISVMGKGLHGAVQGSPAERGAFRSYALLAGEGATWGDGVIPLASGLLAGARRVIIPGLRHDPRADKLWYGGTTAIVRAWWEQVTLAEQTT